MTNVFLTEVPQLNKRNRYTRFENENDQILFPFNTKFIITQYVESLKSTINRLYQIG